MIRLDKYPHIRYDFLDNVNGFRLLAISAVSNNSHTYYNSTVCSVVALSIEKSVVISYYLLSSYLQPVNV